MMLAAGIPQGQTSFRYHVSLPIAFERERVFFLPAFPWRISDFFFFLSCNTLPDCQDHSRDESWCFMLPFMNYLFPAASCLSWE
jgi:hypothetical protein